MFLTRWISIRSLRRTMRRGDTAGFEQSLSGYLREKVACGVVWATEESRGLAERLCTTIRYREVDFSGTPMDMLTESLSGYPTSNVIHFKSHVGSVTHVLFATILQFGIKHKTDVLPRVYMQPYSPMTKEAPGGNFPVNALTNPPVATTSYIRLNLRREYEDVISYASPWPSHRAEVIVVIRYTESRGRGGIILPGDLPY